MILRIALAGVLAIAIGIAAGFAWWQSSLAPPPHEASDAPHRFEVAAGAGLAAVADRLERDGVIRSALAMRMLARLRGLERAMRAGEYELEPGLDTEAVLDRLARGAVRTHPVSIPEGFTAVQVAARLDEAGLADADAFLAYARSPEAARALGVEGDGLEGYLYPETYRMAQGLAVEEVAAVLVEGFREVWQEIEAEATAAGLGQGEVVTLASIIEKETGAAVERPLIASVFLNRLARGMRLETDPTVIYGIPDFDGNLRRVHLEDASNPYNTYRIPALPPGPIANPGGEALRAVVRPAESDYLFFVARGDGTHHFSETYAEHDAMVDRYQRRRSR